MTTLGLVAELLAHFNGKSPRESYAQTCREKSVHLQRQLYNMLPDGHNSWKDIRVLELGTILLGTRGSMAILPIITLSTTLRQISLTQCGLTDEFVKEFCDVLQNCPTMRDVDISKNPLVTVKSAAPIISLMSNNVNIVRFDVTETHVGTNITKLIVGLGAKNRKLLCEYYQDKYFKMKDLFNYLDANGIGWVPLSSLLLNCPYPVLQEQFSKRIAMKRPQKRSDNTISINTFMELVYMNYKTEKEIQEYAEGKINEPYLFVLSNWFQIIEAVKRYNSGNDAKESVEEDEVSTSEPIVVLPDDLHRLRLRDHLLTHSNADKIVAEAVRLAKIQQSLEIEEVVDVPEAKAKSEGESRSESTAAVSEKESGEADESGAEGVDETPAKVDEKLVLPVLCLVEARKSLFPNKYKQLPSYNFFKERDVHYVATHKLGRSSVPDASAAMDANTDAESTTSKQDVSDSENTEEPHTFSLPPLLVKMIIDFFHGEIAKMPSKKVSTVPESPRTKRDRSMEKIAIPIKTFLSAQLVTDLEKLEPRLMADYFARYALPIDDCTITLQEMVNVLDELYVECRIDRPVALEDIMRAQNPLSNDEYANFFTEHLQSKNEDARNYITSQRSTHKQSISMSSYMRS